MQIGFYHLTLSPLEKALPTLIAKAYSSDYRILIMAGSPERVSDINNLLWVYDPASWLPHGSMSDSDPDLQPIYITADVENPNQARLLALIDGVAPENFGDFERCLNLFDGNDETALANARKQWAMWRDAGHELVYYQQSETGGWREKTRTS